MRSRRRRTTWHRTTRPRAAAAKTGGPRETLRRLCRPVPHLRHRPIWRSLGYRRQLPGPVRHRLQEGGHHLAKSRRHLRRQESFLWSPHSRNHNYGRTVCVGNRSLRGVPSASQTLPRENQARGCLGGREHGHSPRRKRTAVDLGLEHIRRAWSGGLRAAARPGGVGTTSGQDSGLGLVRRRIRYCPRSDTRHAGGRTVSTQRGGRSQDGQCDNAGAEPVGERVHRFPVCPGGDRAWKGDGSGGFGSAADKGSDGGRPHNGKGLVPA